MLRPRGFVLRLYVPFVRQGVELQVRPKPEPRRALRLAVQDAALSRRKHGFDSRRARHDFNHLAR
jgi:hypothetical protein